ncbi:MAG TPA: CvpA family protein [Solimonas sp.]|nr:CvpA family protein [Solimonas sp.]
MIWVDYCILAVFILSLIVGLMRGFTREVLGFATWIFAFGLAWLFGRSLASGLEGQISQPALRLVAAYVMLFLGGLLAGSLITYFMSEAIKESFLSLSDRALGGGFGMLRAALLVVILVLVGTQMGAQKQRWWSESLLIGSFQWLADGLASVLPERWLEALRPEPNPPLEPQPSS